MYFQCLFVITDHALVIIKIIIKDKIWYIGLEL